MFFKVLSSSAESTSLSYDDFLNFITTLTFQIPEQVYQVFDTLTRYVGYIMPLRLYTPIIAVILGYWFILILGAFAKFSMNLILKIVTLFA